MRVLVACEFSGIVREAFRKRGHDAWSCDLLPADDGSPHHFQDDALIAVASREWDLLIAHPPCTYLCNSGVQWMTNTPKHPRPNILYGLPRQAARVVAAEFFRTLLDAKVRAVAVENPIMHGDALDLIGVSPTQIVQPFMFGHPETKATCLWLKRLRKLKPTNWLPPPYKQRMFEMAPSENRGKDRSVTYQGIADAMAEQWGSDQPLDTLF